MRILFLGHSSIAQRRVMPALERIDGFAAIDVASRSREPDYRGSKAGEMFIGYAHAISASQADLVYVSLPNALHGEWVLAALAAGKHVVVDKPAMLTLEETERCIAVARSKGLLLAEATVFTIHPQIAALRDFISANGPLTHITAHFVIPPLPAQNFRNSAALGGGCLQDMGPYAAAVARLFVGTRLEKLTAFAGPPLQEADSSFSFLARFSNGVRYAGHFSFESEYQNRLELLGAGGSASTERIFSPPPDYRSILNLRQANKLLQRDIEPYDIFSGFMTAVAASIAGGRHGEFADDMLRDAQFREAIAASLKQERQQ